LGIEKKTDHIDISQEERRAGGRANKHDNSLLLIIEKSDEGFVP
jgi:hypothetical protein